MVAAPYLTAVLCYAIAYTVIFLSLNEQEFIWNIVKNFIMLAYGYEHVKKKFNNQMVPEFNEIIF